MFWMEAEDFKMIPGVDFMKLRAKKMYKRYLAEDAKMQINLPSKVAASLEEAMKNPSRTMFVEAQKGTCFPLF